MINTSHSCIPLYPPNFLKYSKFYNSKEKIIILEPGDMLYIPPMWFHWVFSYPDKDLENLAMSCHINDVKQVCNEFSLDSPFIFHFDKKTHEFLNINSSNFKNNTSKHSSLISETSQIPPVKKNSLYKKPTRQDVQMKDLFYLIKQKKYNISLGQNSSLLKDIDIKIPRVLQNSFPKASFTPYFWLYYIKNDSSYIDSGLHADRTYNVLFQIKGTKVVRLYHPDSYNNMYVQPMNFI